MSIINLLPNLKNAKDKMKTDPSDHQSKQIRPSIFLNFLELPLIFNRKKYNESTDRRQPKNSQKLIKLADSGLRLPYIKSQVPSRLSPCDNFSIINSLQSKKLINQEEVLKPKDNVKQRKKLSPLKRVVFRESIQVLDLQEGSIKRDQISDIHKSLRRTIHRKVKSEFDSL
ncbi:hypothetical protein pb186bvf_005154 [Paramecium bursaria]